MTQELTINAEIVLSFDDKARALLTLSEYEDMTKYISENKPQLALSTANSFFELFISGSDVDDIWRLNPAFPKSVINWCRIKYDWDRASKDIIFKLQQRIADKVMKAQLEAAGLYADIISAANKKHSTNLKKYIQTGDQKYLDKTIDITSVHQLQKAVEGLQKVTGQDKNITVTDNRNVNVAIDVTNSGGELSAETSLKVLSVIAEENRKRDLIKQKG